MPSTTHLRIATRSSPLALWQAHHARDMLLKHWPDLTLELVPITTSGDRFLDTKLLDIGGKGLFVKELEEALLNKHADFAVHSMKDVPATLPEGLEITTLFARQNPFDAFVSNQHTTLASLPKASIVGTSSLRRASQLLNNRPDLIIKPIRGNVGTRLKKLDAGEFDAIILAATGLERLGLDARIQETLSDAIMLPSPGQGALGIECRTGDTRMRHLLAPLHDADTARAVQTERRVNQLLGGSCHTPIAIYCRILNNQRLHLDALVASPDGQTVLRDTQQGGFDEANQLADQAFNALINQGAARFIQTPPDHHA
jgi:hydroxymethylbilane synthase